MLKKIAFGFVVLMILGAFGLEYYYQSQGITSLYQERFLKYEENEAWLMVNTDYARQYFDGFYPETPVTFFRKEKTAENFRVAVMGDATVAGYPFRSYDAFPQRMQSMLEQSSAGQTVEVLNLGIIGSNSFQLVDTYQNVLSLMPDAVIIYTGHDDFYGPYGVASTLPTEGYKGLGMRFRRTGLYQGLIGTSAVETLAVGNLARGDMSRLRVDQAINDTSLVYQGTLFNDALNKYRTNISEVVKGFNEAGVTVYLVELVMNRTGIYPAGKQKKAYEQYDQARKDLLAGRLEKAEEKFATLARDEMVRMKAPAEFNAVLLEIAGSSKLTKFVEIQVNFNEEADLNMFERNVFVDNVHPTRLGHNIIAQSLVERIISDSLLVPVINLAETEIQRNNFEDAYANIESTRLLSNYPFGRGIPPFFGERTGSDLLGQYHQSRNYLDFQNYVAYAGHKSLKSVLRDAFDQAVEKRDTINVFNLGRSRVYLEPLNQNILDLVLDKMAESGVSTELQMEILFHGLNTFENSKYATRLSEIYFANEEQNFATKLEEIAKKLTINQ